MKPRTMTRSPFRRSPSPARPADMPRIAPQTLRRAVAALRRRGGPCLDPSAASPCRSAVFPSANHRAPMILLTIALLWQHMPRLRTSKISRIAALCRKRRAHTVSPKHKKCKEIGRIAMLGSPPLLFHYQSSLFSMKTTNPNPWPIGTRFGSYCFVRRLPSGSLALFG